MAGKKNQKLGRFYNSRRERHLTDKEVFYETLATQIEREDQLVNIRLGWMLTTQALLFAGFAIVGGKDVNPDVYKLMRILMPVMGIGIAFASLLGVLGAHVALRNLKKQWRRNDSKFGEWPYMRPFGNTYASILGFMPSIFFPVIFIIVWSVMLDKLPLTINISTKETTSVGATQTASSDTTGNLSQPDTSVKKTSLLKDPGNKNFLDVRKR